MAFVTLELQKLVTASNLPTDIKFMLVTMLLYGNGETTEGYSSQGTIAGYMSCSRRKVIYAMQELERLVAEGKSPVRIVRTRRGKPGGIGRDSDLYRIEVIPQSALRSPSDDSECAPPAHSDPTKAQTVHLEAPTEPEPQSANSETSKCKNRNLKVQTSAHDHRSDQRSDQRSTSSQAPPAPKTKPFALEPPKPKPAKEPSAYQTVVDHWCTAYERLVGEKPIFSDVDGRDVKRLLKPLSQNAAKACELIDNAFSDEWFRGHGTLHWLASHPSQYQKPSKRGLVPRTPKSGPTQPGTNPRIKLGEDSDDFGDPHPKEVDGYRYA